MFSVSPEIYSVLSLASRWLFAFFALMLLFFAFFWHHSDRKERRKRFKSLPGAGNVGQLVVLSGSEDLPPGRWFPVPREGILGSLRTCDLVVPCSGVRSQHLDFSWQDGTGLLIRPRLGCEVLVDGVRVSRVGAWADKPMIHDSVIQVGSAVLRLQLFSALSHTNRVFTPQAPGSATEADSVSFAPQPLPPAQIPPAAVQSWQAGSYPVQPIPPVPSFQQQPVPDQPVPDMSVSDQSAQVQQEQTQHAMRRRSHPDRWKEDWSE